MIQPIGTLGTLNQSAGMALEAQKYMGDSLRNLGTTIGQVISERQMYADADKLAPFMRKSFMDSYEKIAGGDFAGGLGNLMQTAASVSTNPILARISQEGVRTGAVLMNQYMDLNQTEIMAGRAGKGGSLSANRFNLQVSGQIGNLEKVIANAKMGLNDPTLNKDQKDQLSRRITEAQDQIKYLQDQMVSVEPELPTESGSPAGNLGNVDDQPQSEARIPNTDIPPSLPLNEDGSVAFEQPPEGSTASPEMLAYVSRFRNKQVWEKLTPEQKKRIDTAMENTMDDEDIAKVNANPLLESFKKPDGLIRTPIQLEGSGSEITVATMPYKQTRTSSVGKEGYSSSVTTSPTEIPDQIKKYVEDYNNGIALIPTQARDVMDRFGGVGNFDVTLVGSGDTRTMQLRPKSLKDKDGKSVKAPTITVQTRDENGIRTDMEFSKESEKPIAQMQASYNTLVSSNDMSKGYAVEVKRPNASGTSEQYLEYAKSLTPENLPLGLSFNDTASKLGIDTSKADENVKGAINARVWNIFDALTKDQKFRESVTANPNKAIDSIREVIRENKTPDAKKINELLPKEAKKESKYEPSEIKGLDPRLNEPPVMKEVTKYVIEKSKSFIDSIVKGVKEYGLRQSVTSAYLDKVERLHALRNSGKIDPEYFNAQLKLIKDQIESDIASQK